MVTHDHPRTAVNYDHERISLQFIPEVVALLFELLWICIRSAVAWCLPVKPKCIQGEIVFITGAAGVLGKELTKLFLQRGCRVVLVDINEVELAKAVKELSPLAVNSHVVSYVCDIGNRQQLKDICRQVQREVGHPTVVVNNAAIVGAGKVLDVTEDQIKTTLDVNTCAPFWTLRELLPSMLSNNYGHIITIISIVGKDALVGLPLYCASKFALDGLMTSARREVMASGKDGVHFTSIFPYIINTPLFGGSKLRFRDLPFCNVLEPDYVAAKTLHAMDRNRTAVYLPKLMYFMMILRSFLPEQAYYRIHEFLGSTEAMLHFKGRENPGRQP